MPFPVSSSILWLHILYVLYRARLKERERERESSFLLSLSDRPMVQVGGKVRKGKLTLFLLFPSFVRSAVTPNVSYLQKRLLLQKEKAIDDEAVEQEEEDLLTSISRLRSK